MTLSDRFWLWSNRKSQRPFQSYLRVTFIWALYGWLTGVGMFFLAILPERWYIGTGLIAFCFAMMWWFYWVDKRDGYIDVIHQRWLQRWNEHRERIKDKK